MTCGVCGKAINVVGSHTVKGTTYRYYGCAHSSRNGIGVCSNRLKVRVEAADQSLLAGLQAELLHPETVTYISDQLAAALNAAIDGRPAQRSELATARESAVLKLRNLVAAVEDGNASSAILSAISAREAEIQTLEARIAGLSEPLEQRLAVIPTWVKAQLADVVSLVGDVPQRAKAEFQRLGLGFVLHPVHDDGVPPFLRAVGSGDFEHLTGSEFTPFLLPDASKERAASARS